MHDAFDGAVCFSEKDLALLHDFSFFPTLRDAALEHSQSGEDMKFAQRGEGAWQRGSDFDPIADEGESPGRGAV